MSDDAQHVLRVPDVEVADVPVARRFVRRFLTPDVPAEVVSDLELIASELVTNAWAHAAPATVSVGVSVTAGRATVTVESVNSAASLMSDVTEWKMPAPFERGGRGLGIVRELADDIEIEQRGRNLVIAAHRDFNRSAANAS